MINKYSSITFNIFTFHWYVDNKYIDLLTFEIDDTVSSLFGIGKTNETWYFNFLWFIKINL